MVNIEEDIKELKRQLIKIESMVMDIYDSTISEKRICPICRNEIRLYLPYGVNMRKNAKCPVCNSLERHRTLWLWLEENKALFVRENIRILQFAPEGCFYNKFSLMDHVDYYPVDINPQYKGIRDIVDIMNIQYEDCFFDMIICNHVLEHVPNDMSALCELYRVLKNDGTAIINVPINHNLEVTLEKEEYNTPELREQHYKQSDHMRLYGKDYVKRLERAGFIVEVIRPNDMYDLIKIRNYGLSVDEEIYVCRKK